MEQVTADGSSAEIAGGSGQVSAGGVGWVAVPKVVLPQRQIELKLGAFGRKTTIALFNASGNISVQSSADRADIKWDGESAAVQVGAAAYVEVQ